MLKRMTGMPAGTLGFEAIGKVEDDDFEHAVERVLRTARSRQPQDSTALRARCREGGVRGGHADRGDMQFAVRHPAAYERVAAVSDEDWLRPALRVLSVLVPGQLPGYPVAQLPQRGSGWPQPTVPRR